MAPAENFTPSPFINEKHTFSPNLNTSVSSVGRSSPLGSFLPPPPQLDTFADASQYIGRFDNTDNGPFLFENDNQPTSPFALTRRNCSNRVHNEDMNRARSLSLPANHLRQSSFGTMSPPPAPSGQILYEDKPSSWMEGSGLMSSPRNFDRFNSRPPRHCGSSDTQTLISPRVEMRNTASDGNFHNFPSVVPMFNPMSPVAVANDHRQSQSSISLPLPGVDHPNDRTSFESIDPLNNTINLIQYQSSHQSPQPSSNSNSANAQHDNYFSQHSPSIKCIPTLQRQHSTGSQHFLVNQRGEIIGHASPVITQNSLEARIVGFAPGETKNHANSYGGQHASLFNQIQPQQATPNFNPIAFQNGRSQHNINSSPMDNHVGSIGDGRMQHKLSAFNPNLGGNINSRHPIPSSSDDFNQILIEDNTKDIGLPSEEIRDSTGAGAVEEKASSQSYASKLMMPCPQPVVDQTKARSQLLTAGASLSKSGLRMVYNVKFKLSQNFFVLGQRVTRDIKIGCYVKVEADRGEDLGIVMSIVPMAKFLASNRHRPMREDGISNGDFSPCQATNIGDLKRIMRVATHDEISLLEVKREEEEELLKVCCTKVQQRGLPMSVVDAEYQYDRNKLTFFFQAEGRIDFRELVRDLFSMYKTRIWMQQLDKNGSPEAGGNTAE